MRLKDSSKLNILLVFLVFKMKNILVAIDFSNVTQKVIEQGVLLTRAFDCKLWLIHIAAPDPDFVGYVTGPQFRRDLRAETLRDEHKKLQHQADRLRKQGINITTLLIKGETVDAIVREASKLAADLIVIGSHGHGALYKTLMGSVSEGVIRHAPCPVLIVTAKIN